MTPTQRLAAYLWEVSALGPNASEAAIMRAVGFVDACPHYPDELPTLAAAEHILRTLGICVDHEDCRELGRACRESRP